MNSFLAATVDTPGRFCHNSRAISAAELSGMRTSLIWPPRLAALTLRSMSQNCSWTIPYSQT